MRVPHAPQNANPVGTGRPQLGHVVPSEGDWDAAGAAVPGKDDGATRADKGGVSPAEPVGCACDGTELGEAVAKGTAAADTDWAPEVGRADQVPAPGRFDTAAMGAGVGSRLGPPTSAPPFCCSAAGIFGESPHGIPPLALAGEVGSGVVSVTRIPACDFLSGGTMVRAVSSGAGSREGLATALISLPHPKQNL
jgi:hypothetical protein